MAGVVSAGLRRWLLLGWLRAGVRCLYDLGGNSAGKRAQVLIFSPFLPSCSSSPSSDVLAFSCWLCLFDLGGQVDGIGAAGGGVSIWPGCWACRASPAVGGRAGRSRAVSAVRLPCWPCWAVCAGAGHGRRSQANRLATRQNAQRFNKKCSIMTKIMPCILCFLRCKYACFGVK